MIYHCSGCFSDRNQSVLIGNWLEIGWTQFQVVQSEPTFPIRIRSDKLDKFPTIWVVLCSRISDWIPIRIRAVPTDSTQKTWGTDKTSKLQSTAFLYPTIKYFPRFLVLETSKRPTHKNSYAFHFSADYKDPTFRCQRSTYVRQYSEDSACQHDANEGYAD